jgi:ribosome-associated protein
MTEADETTLAPFLEAVLSRKAIHVAALDVRGLTSIADFFIICSGRSARQVSAIADHVERELRKRKIKPLSVEGATEGQWALIDYGYVILHVFQESARQFYDLDGLWSDAPRLPLPDQPRPRTPAGRKRRPPEAE